MIKILILLIRLYQVSFAHFFSGCCRFEPSCSNYAIEALKKYGVLKGCALSFKRILRCNQYHPGGKDPVP